MSFSLLSARLLAVSAAFALLGHTADAQQAPSPSPDSGLCVVIPATTAQDLIARTKGGRVLVHALATDPAAAARLQTEVVKGGASGLVSVMHWEGFPSLPYSEDLVDELVLDPAGLAGKVPAKAEIDRVLVPKFGVARIRQGAAWVDYRRPMPAGYGEWTHYYHDATNNPVGSDRAGISTGVRWVAELQSGGESHQLVGGGRLVYFNVSERSGFGGIGGGMYGVLRARNAFNGLPLWEQTNNDWKKNALRRYEGAVIDGDRLLHLRTRTGPLVATSMSDGKELMVYDAAVINKNAEAVRIPATTGGDVGTMLILEGRLLYVVSGKDITVLNADTGKLAWRYSAEDPKSYFGFPCIDRKTGTFAVAVGPLGMASGRMTHFRATEYRGFDAVTGKPRWTTPNPITDYIASMATLNGGIYVASAGHLGALTLNLIGMDAATGAFRWKSLDMAIGASGTLMLYPNRAYIGRSALSTFDLADGKLLSCVSTGNSRCDVPRGSATMINNFGHYFDVSDPSKVIWNRREIVRNACGGASLPAYGLRYSSDNRCGCFSAVRGLVALGHQPVPAPIPDTQRLTKGPAFARPLGAEMSGWTSFMGNDRREGAGGPIKSDKPVKRWQVKVATSPATGLLPQEWRLGDSWNGPITAPTIANGKVYVAETAGHRLVCLDGESGRELWSFVADGRIDGPPRLVRGRAVFGCRDGSVYCLDAADGALAWRFQAAPSSRFITAYGQVESAWPVFGAVPVVGDTVLVGAGRHPDADGGIAVWGLKLGTGAVAWKRTLDHPRNPITLPQTGDKYKVPGAEMKQIFDPNRVTNDVMSADKTVFVLGDKRMQVADGADSAEHPEFQLMLAWGNFGSPVRRPSQLDLGGPGGWGGQWGIMDDKLYRYKTENGTLVRGSRPGIWGRPICVAKDHIVVQLYASGHGGIESLICYPRSAAQDGGPHLWEVPARELRPELKIGPAANSMIVAGDRIVMTTSVYPPGTRYPANSPLMIRSLADGKLLHSETLPVPTVDHGLATANGRLYISLDDGSVLCME